MGRFAVDEDSPRGSGSIYRDYAKVAHKESFYERNYKKTEYNGNRFMPPIFPIGFMPPEAPSIRHRVHEEVAAEPEQELSTDVSRRAPNMPRDLYKAAKCGDADFINQLIASDIEQNLVFSQLTPKLNSVLHIAASFGHSQLVEAIEYNCEFWKKKNSAGELAFHVATSCGHLSTLKNLVSASVSCSEFLDIPNNDGNTPLHLALINKYREVDLVSKTKYSEIADFLVETNPVVSYCPNEEHKSPLYMAAEAGDAKMVRSMIENMAVVEGGGRVLGTEEVKSIAHAAITGKNIGKFTSYFPIFYFPAVSMSFSAIPIDKLLIVTKLLGY